MHGKNSSRVINTLQFFHTIILKAIIILKLIELLIINVVSMNAESECRDAENSFRDSTCLTFKGINTVPKSSSSEGECKT